MITHILDIVFITRPHIFYQKFINNLLWNSWFSDFLYVGGRLVGGQWLVGWLVGRWSMVSGRMVGGFKKTLTYELVNFFDTFFINNKCQKFSHETFTVLIICQLHFATGQKLFKYILRQSLLVGL